MSLSVPGHQKILFLQSRRTPFWPPKITRDLLIFLQLQSVEWELKSPTTLLIVLGHLKSLGHSGLCLTSHPDSDVTCGAPASPDDSHQTVRGSDNSSYASHTLTPITPLNIKGLQSTTLILLCENLPRQKRNCADEPCRIRVWINAYLYGSGSKL